MFVVATGRSGSTSLMQLLRQLPGSAFLGENAAWQHFFRLDKELEKARDFTLREANNKNRLPWVYGPRAGRPAFLSVYRDLLYAQLGWPVGPHVRMIGFKDVRWQFYIQKSGGVVLPELRDVDLLLEVFPCAQVILNYREDTDQQANSGFWSLMQMHNHTRVVAEIEKENEMLKLMAQRNPTAMRLVPLSDLQSVPALQALVEWLGFPGCRVTSVVKTNAGGFMSSLTDEEDCSSDTGCTPKHLNRHIDTTNC